MFSQSLPLGLPEICVRVRRPNKKRVIILTIDVAKTFEAAISDKSDFKRRVPRFRTKEAVVRAFVEYQFKKAFGEDTSLQPRRSGSR